MYNTLVSPEKLNNIPASERSRSRAAGGFRLIAHKHHRTFWVLRKGRKAKLGGPLSPCGRS